MFCPKGRAAQAGPGRPCGVTENLRLGTLGNALRRDDHLCDAPIGRHVVHDLVHDLFQHRTQAPGADSTVNGFLCHSREGLRLKLQVHSVILQKLLILLYQSVLGLSKDAHQLLFPQGLKGSDDRQTAYQLWNNPKFQQVMGLDFPQDRRYIPLLSAFNLGTKPDGFFIESLLNNLFNAVKGTTTDK